VRPAFTKSKNKGKQQITMASNILRPLSSKVSRASNLTIRRTLSSITLESTKKTNNDGIFKTPKSQSLKQWQSFHSTSSTATNTASTKAPPARDTRVAGRRRFYKVVDVTPVSSPPWDHFKEEENSIDNPISAGVDGTNSATNISLQKPSRTSMQQSLTPSTVKDSPESISSWYGISLDGRLMKTPLGLPLAVPSLSLAVAIASEWDDQQETIKPAQMPLMTMACTTIDQLTTPSVREMTIDKIMSYLKNDTTCYWSDPTEDRVLHRRQSKYWDSLHEWIEKDGDYGLGSKPAVAIGAGEGLIMSRMRKSKAAGLPHGDELLANARAFLNECDGWTLAAMQNVTMEAKSFLVGMAVVRSVQHQCGPFSNDIKKAAMASRVEEEFQIENWGLVEGGHDYDRINCSIQLHAATVWLESIVTSNVAVPKS
jgi:ATP synthase F1 complex assembly factor 2